MASTPRAVIYCRVSDKGQKDAYGMESQEAECREYAERMGWTVAAVYQDWHTGTELWERPEMTRLLADARAGAFEVVVFHRLDRLSRDMTHQSVALYEIEQAGARWDSATEDVTGPTGLIMRAVLGAMAEIDRTKTVANLARGKRAKAAAGRPIGQGKPSYGLDWKRDAEGRHVGWIEDPETVEHVRRIFRDYDAGLSLRALGKALEADGITPPYFERTGTLHWSTATLRKMLMERLYIGEAAAYRHVCWKERNDVTGQKTRRSKARPESEQVKLPAGIAPVVIAPEVFERVQARLTTNADRAVDYRTTRNPEIGILRRGLAYCGTCGNKLIVTTATRGAPMYRCIGRKYAGCPVSVGMSVDAADDAVWNYLKAILSDEDRVAWHIEQMRTEDPTARDRETIERQRAELEKKRSRLVALATSLEDDDAAAALAPELDRITQALKSNAQALEDLRLRHAAWSQQQAVSADVLETCRKIAADMERVTDWLDRRAIAQALKVRFELYPKDDEPRWIVTSEVVPEVATSGNVFTTCRRSGRAAGRGCWSARASGRRR
jgi:site-specific DNA recombinase